MQIDWQFNPPTASWCRGWWERLIGMMKVILHKVLGEACHTYKEIYTVLCDCELTLTINVRNIKIETYVIFYSHNHTKQVLLQSSGPEKP